MIFSKNVHAGLMQFNETARSKAFEISVALQSVGVEESKSLRIAIATAKHLEGTDLFVLDCDEDSA